MLGVKLRTTNLLLIYNFFKKILLLLCVNVHDACTCVEGYVTAGVKALKSPSTFTFQELNSSTRFAREVPLPMKQFG